MTVQGPVLIRGWEVGILSNEQRLQTVQEGLRVLAQNAIRQLSENKQAKFLSQMLRDVGEYLGVQAQAGLMSSGSQKRSGKERRCDDLPGPKKKKR